MLEWRNHVRFLMLALRPNPSNITVSAVETFLRELLPYIHTEREDSMYRVSIVLIWLVSCLCFLAVVI